MILLSGCITPAQFYALEDDVRELKSGGGGGQGERLAELSQEIESLREQLAELRGQVEEARHVAEQALAEAEAARRAPPAAGAAAPGAAPGRSGELPAVASVPAPATRTIDGDPAESGTDREVQDYEAAFRLYRAGDYQAAVQHFQSFVQAHPRSDYADNALFWMGECYQKQGDFVLAAVTFERVHKEFPDGNKVPDALYRQAIALIEIGKQKGEQAQYASAAREVLQRIVDEYPRSERVEEARRQLDKLAR